MTCYNCIYNDICSKKYNHMYENYYILDAVNIESVCKTFKDKSKFIELPCKVGDTVYVLPTETNSLKEITPYKVIDFILAKWNPDDFGKTVFLTLEQAEEKLKEMNEND